jgi:hypothetical protein
VSLFCLSKTNLLLHEHLLDGYVLVMVCINLSASEALYVLAVRDG